MTERATEADAGCWIEGHWGQYGPARLCEIALERGWNDDKATELPFAVQHRSTADLVAQKLASMGPSDTDPPTADEEEQIIWASEDAETWLNENVAPEGHYFTWEDGEFFLFGSRADEDVPGS